MYKSPYPLHIPPFQPWNPIVEWLFNRHRKLQGFYEATFLARLFPAHSVDVELIK
jgi:hypothetical protein